MARYRPRGDPLEHPAAAVDFERFRTWSYRGISARHRSGGRVGRSKCKQAKAKPDGIAVPVRGCEPRAGIDTLHGIIRRRVVMDVGAHDGARFREGLIDPRSRFN